MLFGWLDGRLLTTAWTSAGEDMAASRLILDTALCFAFQNSFLKQITDLCAAPIGGSNRPTTAQLVFPCGFQVFVFNNQLDKTGTEENVPYGR